MLKSWLRVLFETRAGICPEIKILMPSYKPASMAVLNGANFMKALARREEMLENRFVHEQTLRFQFEARRNKALADWASSLMGKTDDEAELYRDEIIALSIKTDGDKAIVERVSLDLAMAGAAVSQLQVRVQLNALQALIELDAA